MRTFAARRAVSAFIALAMLLVVAGPAGAAPPPAAPGDLTSIVVSVANTDAPVSEVTVRIGGLDIDASPAVTGTSVYNGGTATDIWTIATVDQNYSGSTPANVDYPQSGSVATISVVVGTTTYWYTATLTASPATFTAGAVVVRPAGASLSGRVYGDVNANGTYNVASDTLVSDAAVISVYKAGTLVATANTVSSLFTIVVNPGVYAAKADITGAEDTPGSGTVVGLNTDPDDLDDGIAGGGPITGGVTPADEGEVMWFQNAASAANAIAFSVPGAVTGVNFGYANKAGSVNPATFDHADIDVAVFTDILGHWARADITELRLEGVVQGRSDGTFGPDEKISRAEFAAMLSNATGVTTFPVTIKSTFSDVPVSHWASHRIEQMAAMGVVVGTKAGTFAPDANISRAEATAMLARFAVAQGLVADVTDLSTPANGCDTGDLKPATLTFLDVPTTHWAAKEIVWLAINDVVKGHGNGTFGPTDTLTRGQMAALLNRALNLSGYNCLT